MNTCEALIRSFSSNAAQLEAMLSSHEMVTACLQWDAIIRAGTAQAKAARYAGLMTFLAGTSAFLAGFLTLLGVQLQIRAGRRQQKLDQEYSLQKEAYLASIEALSLGTLAIPQLIDLRNTSTEVLRAYFNAAPSIARIHIVANLSTAEKVINVANHLGGVHAEIINRRLPLEALQGQIAIQDGLLADAMKAMNEINAEMERHNLDKPDDGRRFDVLQRSFQFRSGQHNALRSERNRLARGLFEQQMNYAQVCLSRLGVLIPFVTEAVIAIRVELGFPINATEYRRMMKDLTTQAAKQSTDSLDETKQAAESIWPVED